MSLRGRIILFVSAAVVALTVGLLAAAQWRERRLEVLAHSNAAAAAERLWAKVVEKNVAAQVAWLQGGLTQASDLAEALAAAPVDLARLRALGDAAAIVTTAGEAGVDFQLFNMRGDMLYAAAGAAARPALDGQLIGRMAELKLQPRGVEMAAAGPVMVVATPIQRADGSMVGAAALLTPIHAALSEFGGALGAESFLLGPDGALIGGGAPSLWEHLKVAALTPERARSVVVDERDWSVATAPVARVGGGRFGMLAAAFDVTDSRDAAAVAAAVTMLAATTLAALILVVLHTYLNRQFEPLTSALGSMRALRFGDTSVEIAGLGRKDEIGQVAEAVKAMRDHTEVSILAAERGERARLRQMRVIRSRLSSLAETLDEDARREVLADLDRIERQSAEGRGGQTAALAAAMQVMTERVASQRQSLDALVAELRDSLATKSALAALQEQMSFAGRLRESILPRGFPPRPDLEAAGRLDAADAFAGEFYDFITLDDGRIGVVLGAVGGEGLPAAFLAVAARTLARDGLLFNLSPAGCLARVNLLLLADNRDKLPVALALGALDPKTGLFVFASGGYPPPLLIPRLGDVSEAAAAIGKPLGLERNLAFVDAAIELTQRGALLFVGPGALETAGPNGERFGKPRAQAAAKEAVDLAPAALVDGVLQATAGFAATPRDRDAACVALRWLGPTT